MRSLCILGSTGSIGTQALDVIDDDSANACLRKAFADASS
jgi:1-deoxy-D-xylulose 5-phosphate reductoisomerase